MTEDTRNSAEAGNLATGSTDDAPKDARLRTMPATSSDHPCERSSSRTGEMHTTDGGEPRLDPHDPAHGAQAAQASLPTSNDTDIDVAPWDDPSIQGWGYWPPEPAPCQSSSSPGQTSAGPSSLAAIFTFNASMDPAADDSSGSGSPQRPVYVGPPYVCPVCERRYIRPSCLSTHMNIHNRHTRSAIFSR